MSKKTTKRIDADHNLRDFRYFGQELETLGRRIDAARSALEKSNTVWAQTHWQQVIDSLLFQWRNLPILRDCDAKVTDRPRWTVSYDFYERDDGIGHGITDRIFDQIFRDPDLNASWERAQAARLARNQ